MVVPGVGEVVIKWKLLCKKTHNFLLIIKSKNWDAEQCIYLSVKRNQKIFISIKSWMTEKVMPYLRIPTNEFWIPTGIFMVLIVIGIVVGCLVKSQRSTIIVCCTGTFCCFWLLWFCTFAMQANPLFFPESTGGEWLNCFLKSFFWFILLITLLRHRAAVFKNWILCSDTNPIFLPLLTKLKVRSISLAWFENCKQLRCANLNGVRLQCWHPL